MLSASSWAWCSHLGRSGALQALPGPLGIMRCWASCGTAMGRTRSTCVESEAKMTAMANEPLDVERVLQHAQGALVDPPGHWRASRHKEKQRFQRIIGPYGVLPNWRKLGTAVASLVRLYFCEIPSDRTDLTSSGKQGWNQIGPWLQRMQALQGAAATSAHLHILGGAP